VYLLREARRLGLSGVQLKDRSGALEHSEIIAHAGAALDNTQTTTDTAAHVANNTQNFLLG
jgi:hypothetical protein